MILYSTYACTAVIFLSNTIEDSVDATTHIIRRCTGRKQKATALALESQTMEDANIRCCKDRQPKWNVMALIHAKKKEHGVTKLTKMSKRRWRQP
jgi:hypothetical protein